MTSLDYIVVVLGVTVLLAAGFGASHWSRRRDTGDFILGGRKLPWWLAGTAMVAGASNCDSPLHQSAKIRREGLGGGWFYWTQVLAFVWHSIVFSRLWRRTEVNTVVEFYDIRYASRGGQIARQWSMVFASLLGGIIGLALGLLAMIKICQVLLGLTAPVLVAGHAIEPEVAIVVVGVALALSYTLVSGLLGVVAGDLVEFMIAMTCSYLLMWYAYRAVGYSEGLREGLTEIGRNEALSFTPAGGISLLVFFVVQPFASLAGDNALNQRFLAIRDERHAVLSGIWRLINHYFIRCWPWYLCGLTSLLLLPDLGIASETAYPRLIAEFMPEGLRGLMFAGFLVAFMSSVCSAMHTSGSVFVNDFYRVHIVKNASERHYVWAIRVSMLVIAGIGTSIALSSDQILRLLQIGMTIVGASGVLMLLRWFWWRVNGWADLAAQVLGLPVTLFFTQGPGREWVRALAARFGNGSADDNYGLAFLFTVVVSSALWIIVMLLTKPEPDEKLCAFYRKVRPYGFWGPVARLCPDVVVTDSFARDVVRYIYGLTLSLCLLFGLGLVLLGRPLIGGTCMTIGVTAGLLLLRSVNRDYRPSRPVDPAPKLEPVTIP